MPVAVLGHKADVALMAVGPDLWRLRSFQSEVVAAGLTVVDSYVSLTELSEYAQGLPEAMAQAGSTPSFRPKVSRPGASTRCPSVVGRDKNWFTLPFEDRDALMREHGSTGRGFAGRILQLITGSAGVDDYEWGVTLFAQKPDDLKEVVYKMRFDKASALYADFGPFVTGMVGSLDEVLDGAEGGALIRWAGDGTGPEAT